MVDTHSDGLIAALLEIGGIEVDALVASKHADEISRLATLNARIADLGLTNPIPDAKPWNQEPQPL